jgi:hypothetical protein
MPDAGPALARFHGRGAVRVGLLGSAHGRAHGRLSGGNILRWPFGIEAIRTIAVPYDDDRERSRLFAWGRCGYAFDLELAAADLFRYLLQVGHELFASDECSAYLLGLEGRYRRVAKHLLQVDREDQDGEHVSAYPATDGNSESFAATAAAAYAAAHTRKARCSGMRRPADDHQIAGDQTVLSNKTYTINDPLSASRHRRVCSCNYVRGAPSEA